MDEYVNSLESEIQVRELSRINIPKVRMKSPVTSGGRNVFLMDVLECLIWGQVEAFIILVKILYYIHKISKILRFRLFLACIELNPRAPKHYGY